MCLSPRLQAHAPPCYTHKIARLHGVDMGKTVSCKAARLHPGPWSAHSAAMLFHQLDCAGGLSSDAGMNGLLAGAATAPQGMMR